VSGTGDVPEKASETGNELFRTKPNLFEGDISWEQLEH
jgi:hypothetical protein